MTLRSAGRGVVLCCAVRLCRGAPRTARRADANGQRSQGAQVIINYITQSFQPKVFHPEPSSVGRAKDCNLLMISLGPEFDSQGSDTFFCLVIGVICVARPL